MKWKYALGIMMFLLATVNKGFSQQCSNLITNGSLDCTNLAGNDEFGQGLVAGWSEAWGTPEASNAIATPDPTTYAKFWCMNNLSEAIMTPVAITSGNQYVLKFWYQRGLETANNVDFLNFHLFNIAGSGLPSGGILIPAGQNIVTITNISSTNWVEATFCFTANANFTDLLIYTQNINPISGWIYLDNIRIFPVGLNVPNYTMNCNAPTVIQPNCWLPSDIASYTWTPSAGLSNANIPNPTVSTNVDRNYSISMNIAACNLTLNDNSLVDVPAAPAVSILFGPPNPCPGDPVNLGLMGGCIGCQYLWSDGSISSSTTVYPTTNTTYSVTVTNPSGCIGTASQLITVNPNCLVNQFCKYIQRVGFLDTGAAIEQTADGGFVVVGSMNESSTDRDLYFAKFDANYNIVPGSRKRIGDNSTATLFTDVAYSIVIGSDAYFVIGESRNNTTGDKDVFVARINSTTYTLDWANRYGGTRNEAGIEGVLASSPTGAVTLIIVGQTNHVSVTNDDVFALKINTTAASLGSLVTLNTYKVFGAGANEMGTGIKKVSGVFEYIVTARYIAAGNEDIFCFKIQDNLTPAPGATPFRSNGNGNDYAFGLEEIGNNVYLIGRTSTWGTTTNQDIYLLEVNKTTLAPTGPSRTFAVNSTSIEQAYKGQVTTDGNMVIVGDYQTTTPTTTPTKGLAIKVRINPGQLDHLTNMWQIALTNANSNAFYNVSPLGANHVAITGKYGISSTDEDIFISKVNDLNPLATSCCFKAPVMTSSSGKSTIAVTLDPKNDVWTVTAHKKEIQTGTVITNCIDYSVDGNRIMDIPSAIEFSSVENAMQVYPNPNNGIFSVKLSNPEDLIEHVRVIDATGREVKVQWKSGNTIELNLEQEAAGIYFLDVISTNGRYSSRISVH
ncbi:MAG: T9SS type A sorting domain-containing protein [Bacteroidia bacterium]|nr:T9SS type A sorting domain-containing protein [Bacteroidia bacterium]